MQIEILPPDIVKGRVVLPSSKSISNRALVLNALAGNRQQLPDNVSDCDDTRVMIQWLTGNPDVVDIGAAGTAMRFSSALLAVSEGTHIITGTDRMKHRPIGVLVDALRQLGADVEYVDSEGFPPLRITGCTSLRGGALSLPGNVSSQYISALLMIGPSLAEGLVLTLTDDVVSRPYIDLTLQLMREFGAKAEWMDDRTINVEPCGYKSRSYFVESDWSASSYWYEMVALSDGAEVELPGLFEKSYQGDSKVADIFRMLGVETQHDGDVVKIVKSGVAPARLDYDFVEQPDLAQTFVVTCCMMGVPFHFTGLQSLKIKETDRIEALKAELRKLGYVIEDRNDSELLWDGQTATPTGEAIDTYEDHRMAMAFAPCALTLGRVLMNDPHVVSKSYPKYWTDLESVGYTIRQVR